MFEKLNREHPRLCLTKNRFEDIKNQIKIDPFLKQLVDALLKKADEIIELPSTEFKITGPRMLKNCQQILARITTLILAFYLTEDKKYVDRTKQELFTAADYPHWNKDHFLDTAELVTAFAIAYDWLYHELAKSELLSIKKALLEKGLIIGLKEQEAAWWIRNRYNWNQVCHGGLLIGALALADEEGELCDKILRNSIRYLPIALETYSPDGGWEAGPEYWEYATQYSTLVIDALRTALNDDFGLSDMPGVNFSGLFPVHAAGPFDLYFNFADADPEHEAKPSYFWLGKKFNLKACINENHRLLKEKIKNNGSPDAFDIIWYQPFQKNVEPLSQTAIFEGVKAFFMRSQWHDPNAFFVGFKGGNNQADHAHLDLGSFVLDAVGERWAFDLGRDNYDLPGYWDFSEGGERWKYFRLNNLSHNTLTINNDFQRADADAPITHYGTSDKKRFAIADLTKAYLPHVKSVLRGVALLGGDIVVVQDEILWLSDEKKVCWNLVTDAEISVNKQIATLEKAGKVLFVKIVSPISAEFNHRSILQKIPQKLNENFHQLTIEFNEKLEQTTICVILATNPGEMGMTPLQRW